MWQEIIAGALVVGTHLERAARTGGGLLEDQGDVLAGHALALVAGVLGALEVAGEIEQVLHLSGGEVEFLEVVAVTKIDGHCFSFGWVEGPVGRRAAGPPDGSSDCRTAQDRAGHAARSTPATAEFGTDDAHDLDALLA